MRKPWDLPPGSQGCTGTGREYRRRRGRRRIDGGRLLLACVTLANVALSLALAVYNRGEILHAVRTQDGEGAQVLLTAKKGTKT
ncbi:MAG: hypothetical protein ACOYJZ_05195 [Acutalibacter sp.]|jgi:hypothetical protein